MLHLLADVPATQPDYFAVWLPTHVNAMMRSIITFSSIVIVGILILYLARSLLSRFKIRTPYLVAVLVGAFYAGVFAYRPKQFEDPNDPIVPWVQRLAAAAFIYVAYAFLDRLVVVPLLTRGGKIALSRFVHQIVKIVLACFFLLIYGHIAFGWDIDRFLAGSAVVSIVLGLALQETLGNFFSGLVMQASPPFTLGNWIVCGSHEGRVVDMTWRAVTLHTEEDNFILIPNATVAKADIINYHAPSTANARAVKIGLEYHVPPLEAIALLEAAARESEGVLPSPPPDARVLDFGDSAIIYKVKFWINDPRQHDEIEHFVRVSLWYRLKEKGYAIPFPIRTVEYVSLDKKNARLHQSAVERRVRSLGKVPLLQPLSDEQKKQLAATANDLDLAPGQILFRQNDPGDSFFVIVSGSVDVLLQDPKNPANSSKVATLSTGEFFGEMSALTGQPRSATIRAASALCCIQIEKADLFQIFSQDPALMDTISRIVAERTAGLNAAHAGPSPATTPEAVTSQQKSLLTRMKRFFRLGE